MYRDLLPARMYHIAKIFGKGHFGEFGKFPVIHQSLTLQIMPLENCTKSMIIGVKILSGREPYLMLTPAQSIK